MRVPIGSVLAEIRTGPFGSLLHKADYVENGVPLVNPMHIVDGNIIADRSLSVGPQKMKELSRYILRPGNIVMARRGEMGRCAVVNGQHGKLLCGTGSMILFPNVTKLDPNYAAHMIRTPEAKRFLYQPH